jgi:hypothetical protein
MPQKQLAVLSCIEHERLEFELFGVRYRREQQALSSLVDHELEQHGWQRLEA